MGMQEASWNRKADGRQRIRPQLLLKLWRYRLRYAAIRQSDVATALAAILSSSQQANWFSASVGIHS